MDTHPPCFRCRTTDPDAFGTPTAAYCLSCWAWKTDYSRQFHDWVDRETSSRWPFFIRRGS